MGNQVHQSYEAVNFDSEIWDERYGRGDAPDEWYPALNWRTAKAMMTSRPADKSFGLEQSLAAASLETGENCGSLVCLEELLSPPEAEFGSLRRLSLSTSATDPDSAKRRLSDAEGLLSSEARRFLVVGCGTSALSSELCEEEESGAAAPVEVVSVDISQTAIEISSQRYGGTHGGRLHFLQMDALELSFPSESFDVVVDKATLDCMLCSSRRDVEVPRLIEEIGRVLRPGGEYVIMSTTEAQRCRPFFDDRAWNFTAHTLKVPHPTDLGCSAADDEDAKAAVVDLHWLSEKGAWSTSKKIKGRSLSYFVYRCVKITIPQAKSPREDTSEDDEQEGGVFERDGDLRQRR